MSKLEPCNMQVSYQQIKIYCKIVSLFLNSINERRKKRTDVTLPEEIPPKTANSEVVGYENREKLFSRLNRYN